MRLMFITILSIIIILLITYAIGDIAIAMTVIFSMFFVFVPLFLIYYLFISRRRHYSYDEHGKKISNINRYSNFFSFFIIFFIFWTVLRFTTDIGNISIIIALMSTQIVYLFFYTRAGSEEIMLMNRKRKREEIFIQSIAPTVNTCQSCLKDLVGPFCENCGFDNTKFFKE